MNIENLQINHLSAPFGIGTTPIRVSWTLSGGKCQTAFRVTVTDGALYEDSGKIGSSRMFYVLTRPLRFRSDYTVAVTVWDEDGVPSAPASIPVTTGIENAAWQAKWIDPELPQKPKERQRGAYLRREFEAPAFQKARLYITCHGIMNVYLNGEEVTQKQLMPGTSQYNRRLMVETLDVTAFVKPGHNTLVVTLGDGWYRGSMSYGQSKNVFGTDLALLAQLELDGVPCVVTEERWLASNDGPLGLNDMMAGEEYDARRESTQTWHPVTVRDFGFDNLYPVDTVPILPQETFRPTLLTTPKGETVLDFGQNLVGYVALDLAAREGQTITLTHGETLDGDGNFTIENFQAMFCRTEQKITYICKEGRNRYHPTKTYMGFRYVKVDGDIRPDPEAFTAVAIYSDIRTTARFECGVPEVNQLFQNALWSMKGNFVDVPTDCPTREKSGYSGDCQAFLHTAMYLMDCYPVYAKWIREQAATQFPDGCVAQIAPSPDRGKTAKDGGIGWCDSFEIVPWKLNKRYGDNSLTEEHYLAIKRFMDYRITRSRAKMRRANRKRVPAEYQPYVLDSDSFWGEWLEPDQGKHYRRDLYIHGDLEISTTYLAVSCRILAEMAGELGRNEEAAWYARIAEKAQEAYRTLFFQNGRIEESRRQCRYVRPVAMDMIPEEAKAETAAALSGLIETTGNHLGTGFLTTHELCRVLSDYGQSKKAYDLLLQRDAPGWLYSVLQGATTIPENWNAYGRNGERKDSFNHYSYGAIAGWLMDSVCGIRVENGEIAVKPVTDRRLGYAKASYNSPLGTIVSGWRYESGKILFDITIPANASAVIDLPDGRHMVASGSWHFETDAAE